MPRLELVCPGDTLDRNPLVSRPAKLRRLKLQSRETRDSIANEGVRNSVIFLIPEESNASLCSNAKFNLSFNTFCLSLLRDVFALHRM